MYVCLCKGVFRQADFVTPLPESVPARHAATFLGAAPKALSFRMLAKPVRKWRHAIGKFAVE